MKWLDNLKKKFGSKYIVVQQVRVYWNDKDNLVDTMYYKTTVVNTTTLKSKVIKNYSFMKDGIVIYLWW